jgi:hypothetical protein
VVLCSSVCGYIRPNPAQSETDSFPVKPIENLKPKSESVRKAPGDLTDVHFSDGSDDDGVEASVDKKGFYFKFDRESYFPSVDCYIARR